MHSSPKECHDELLGGAKLLATVLSPLGFEFRDEYVASSSGGAFANGYFESRDLRIGLIVRRNGLGAIVHESGEYQAEHTELLHALGFGNRIACEYQDSSMRTVAKNGGNAFEAVRADLEQLLLPLWRESPEAVSSEIRRIREASLARLFGKPAK